MIGYNDKLAQDAAPRIERVMRLRAAGETWKAIGELLGISKQRAQQLAARGERARRADGAVVPPAPLEP